MLVNIEMDIKKFNGQRLRDALQFRAKTMSDLSRETGISRQSLSFYANNDNIPPFENVQKISEGLSFPIDYFMTEDMCTTITNNTYFRSQATAKKKEQNAQKIKLEYTAKMYEILLQYVDFPELKLPYSFDFNSNIHDPQNMGADSIMSEIEELASYVRKSWKIDDGPIENMQYLLESNGIIVTGFKNVDNKIDAFSQKVNIKGKGSVYIVALVVGEKPQCRLNFDMAHELGHILMHNWDDSNDELDRDSFINLERQANMFASALLLPQQAFSKDVSAYATDVEFYRLLKKKWHVSMQAMMYRARQLNIITENQFQYMMRTISAKGWRTHEPFDTPGILNINIFQSAIDLLFEGGYLTARDLIKEFYINGVCLEQEDMEDLMGLKPGTLNTCEKNIQFIPKIKINK